MVRSRFSLLGLVATAIGLMALFASAAQAETGARWLVLTGTGSAVYSDAEIEARGEKFEGSLENNTGTLLGKILGLRIAIKCTAGTILDALLTTNASTKPGGKVKFTGCTMTQGGSDGLLEPAEGCEPHSEGAPVGTVETRAGHALGELFELTGGTKDDITLILPDNAQQEFATLEMGPECAFGQNIPVFGKLAFKDCQNEALVHKVTHLVEEFAAGTHLYLISDTAEHLETKLDGSANIKLASGKSYAYDLK